MATDDAAKNDSGSSNSDKFDRPNEDDGNEQIPSAIDKDDDSIASLRDDVHRYLTSAPASEFHGRPVIMGDRLPGSQHLLWRAESDGVHTVVKFFLDAGQARSRRQYEGQRIYAPAGLAPQPLWYDRYPTGLSRQILVYKWLPGRQLRLQIDTDVIALAETVAKVHNFQDAGHNRLSPRPINLDFFWRILQPGLERTVEILRSQPVDPMSAVFVALVRAASNLVDSVPAVQREAVPVPIHGDLSIDHALVHEGHVALVDWEMFGLGDAAQEIAGFLTMQGRLLGQHSNQFLKSYLDARNSAGLEERVTFYMQLLPLRALDFLIQGLHEARANSAAGQDAEQFQFIFDTLLATTEQALTKLDVCRLDARSDAVDAVTNLFQSWFPAETNLIRQL